MRPQQLIDWMVFEELEPFGDQKMADMFGSVVQVIANVNRDKKKRPQIYELEDCKLYFGDAEKPKPKVMPWQQMKAYAQAIAESHNARIRGAA